MKNTNALPLQILEILYQYPDPEHLIECIENLRKKGIVLEL